MTTVYTVPTKIVSLKEHFENTNWRIVTGPDGTKTSECDRHSLGWFITLEGSRESMFLGKTKPELREGQKVVLHLRIDGPDLQE